MTYSIEVAGLKRELPICKVTDDLYIGAFICFGDAELTVACARELLKLVPADSYDYIFTAEAKSIPLIHEMARQSGAAKYFIARKGAKAYMPDQALIDTCQAIAKETGAVVEYGEDRELIKGADALYTDIWASMGEEDKIPERVKLLTPYKVTGDVMKATENSDCIFLHCLPSFHDFDTTMAASQKELGYDIREVTDEVFLSPNSKVFDEAENRMHTIKAVMVATIGNV